MIGRVVSHMCRFIHCTYIILLLLVKFNKIHKNSYDWMHLVRMAVALALTRCKFSLL